MKQGVTAKISLCSAIVVAVILLLAAAAKYLFPLPLPYYIDRIAIFIDVFVALAILFFNRSSIIWLCLSLLVSLWLGYSFFWFVNNASCGCFGAFKGVTTGLAIGLDLLIIALSWMNMALLGASTRTILLTIFCSVLVALTGFWAASAIFYIPSSAPSLGQ